MGAWLCQAGQVLRAAAIENPRMEARELLAHAMGTTTDALLRDPRAPVAPEAGARFTAALKRRAAREPLQLILGTAGFWTLTLEVSRDTLIPRPDTETLIEAALELRPDRASVRRILDLGTGTGALLLAALAEYPGATGLGVDRVPGAVALAARNAARNGLAERVSFAVGHWADAVGGSFDLVLSNPPYIESAAIPALMPEVAVHEPASALDGGADGLAAYRAILAGLPRLLAPGGLAVLELGEGQAPAVTALAAEAGLRVRGLRDDLAGIPRALTLALPEKAVGATAESP
ncbi:MAG: peptide chain release factor N(5)-glutamine methyltransferase [Acetobacteraceae bacterium]|nr:peptide chain release factor N(5)-glutamine methyltransferase [Acetobacteraceae bacterium]